jgi:hypothetical protein
MKCKKCGKTRLSGEAVVRIPCSQRERVFFEQGEIKLEALYMRCDCGHSWKARTDTVNKIKDDQNV